MVEDTCIVCLVLSVFADLNARILMYLRRGQANKLLQDDIALFGIEYHHAQRSTFPYIIFLRMT